MTAKGKFSDGCQGRRNNGWTVGAVKKLKTMEAEKIK